MNMNYSCNDYRLPTRFGRGFAWQDYCHNRWIKLMLDDL